MTIHSFSICDAAVSTFTPQRSVDLHDAERYRDLCASIALDKRAQVNFDDALRSHAGDLLQFRRNQAAWADQRAGDAVRVFVEPELSVSDMVIAALDKMTPRRRTGGPAIVVNCQNAREVAYSHSTASRAIHHLGQSGISFSTGHCGLVGSFQALEVALQLAQADRTGSVVLLAGDRWANVYPRVLGDWPVLSDGAAAMTLSLQAGGQPTLHLLLKNLERPDRGTLTKAEDEGDTLCRDICEKLLLLIGAAGLPEKTSIRVMSPATTAGVARRVEARLTSTKRCFPMMAAGPQAHFGVADPLFRLQRAMADLHQGAAIQTGWTLVWDFDPSGILGACLVSNAVFGVQTESAAA